MGQCASLKNKAELKKKNSQPVTTNTTPIQLAENILGKLQSSEYLCGKIITLGGHEKFRDKRERYRLQSQHNDGDMEGRGDKQQFMDQTDLNEELYISIEIPNEQNNQSQPTVQCVWNIQINPMNAKQYQNNDQKSQLNAHKKKKNEQQYKLSM